MSQQEKDTREGQAWTLSGKQQGTTTQQARRRLLKAATMAPVIYTLPAGAQTAAGSISCADNPGNVLDVTRNGDNVLVQGENFCTLPSGNAGSGSICTTEHAEYIFEGDQHGGTITAGSCWNSLNPLG